VLPPTPASAGRDAWPSYASLAVVGFLLYAVGAVAPYLRTDLGLSNAQVGLHSTVMAVGLTLSGVVVTGLARVAGEAPVRAAAIVGLVLATVGLGLAPSLGVTLAAALTIGFGTGTLLGYANATLARPGGHVARLRLARANVWAMVAGFLCPIAIGAVAALGLPWGLGLAAAFVPLALASLDLPAAHGRVAAKATPARGRLSRGFWVAWGLAAAAVAMEFSIIFWGSTLVARRTGTDIPTATLLAGLFIGGMLTGRVVQSLGLGTGGDPRRPAVVGVALAASGAALAWASTIPVVSGVALFVAGLGVGGLYPLAAAAAMAAAPAQLSLAGPRLTLASGLAIMVAPFALGIVTDATGVLVGWALALVIAAGGLAFAAGLPGRLRS
jgi:MFS family permease